MTPEDQALAADFGLDNAELLEASAKSRFIRGSLPELGRVLLKIATPDAFQEETRGAALLDWYGGDGAARVLGRRDGVVLLEWIDGPRLIDLWQAGHHEEAVEVSIALVMQLHGRAGALPEGLLPLHAHFAKALDWRPPSPLLARARDITASCLAEAREARPLHGDIHPRNILKRRGDWCVIDPLGLSGPPTYDYANLFLNPWDHADVTRSSIFAAHLADMICVQTGYPRDEIIGWAIANAYWWAWARESLELGRRHPEAVLDTLFGL